MSCICKNECWRHYQHRYVKRRRPLQLVLPKAPLVTDCGSCGAQATGCAPAAVAATLPSQDQKPLLILLSYHKTGTVWWEQTFLWNQSAHLEVQWILEPFADTYELQSLLDVIAIGNPNMHVVTHITTQLERAGRPWRAVLMTRDPRDSIVSALHYHKWYNEIERMFIVCIIYIPPPTRAYAPHQGVVQITIKHIVLRTCHGAAHQVV